MGQKKQKVGRCVPPFKNALFKNSGHRRVFESPSNLV